jgi:hypothetical protein
MYAKLRYVTLKLVEVYIEFIIETRRILNGKRKITAYESEKNVITYMR